MDWKKSDGLIPTIIQDSETNQVLMLGYMNEEALRLTQESQKVTFYSRTRKCIWVKGETSGNTLKVVQILPDCDQDALLILAQPQGPTCHRNTESCFDVAPKQNLDFLLQLEGVIQDRFDNPSTEGARESYVKKLKDNGLDRIAQKVGEEAIETVIASKNEDLSLFENEAADLIFHLLVLLRFKGSSITKVANHLKQRHAGSS